MKRTKKLLALVLALMMAISCMAVPAMAAGGVCGACGSTLSERTEITTQQIRVGGCSKSNISHTHIRKTIYNVTECTNGMCTRGTVRNFQGTADDCLYPQ